jgi:hypothetical protein
VNVIFDSAHAVGLRLWRFNITQNLRHVRVEPWPNVRVDEWAAVFGAAHHVENDFIE